jgi:hypothetical protein
LQVALEVVVEAAAEQEVVELVVIELLFQVPLVMLDLFQ